MTTIRVIVWEWRDGSPHLEVPTVSLVDESQSTEADGSILTHLDTGGHRFETACGLKWFGKTSSSGHRHSHAINCPQCRRVFFDPTTTFKVDIPEQYLDAKEGS